MSGFVPKRFFHSHKLVVSTYRNAGIKLYCKGASNEEYIDVKEQLM